MSRRHLPVILLLCFYWVGSLIAFNLPEYSLTEIWKLVEENCVILAVKPKFSHNTSQAVVKLVSLLETGLHNADIPVGLVDFDQLLKDRYLHFNLGLVNHEALKQLTPDDIIVLDRKPQDRTCLVKTGLTYKELNGAVYHGPLDLSSLLEFINFRCFLHWTLDGEFTTQGTVRQKIKTNLFRVDELKNAVSMKKLVETCGSDLKNLFYTGQCSSTDGHCAAEEGCDIQIEPTIIPKCEIMEVLPSKEEFVEKWLYRSKPVIFRKAITKWSAFTKWTNDHLRERYGGTEVHIKLTPPKGEYEGVEPRSLWNASEPMDIPQEVVDQLSFPDLVMVRPEGVEMKFKEFLDIIERKVPFSRNMSAYLEYTPIRDYLTGMEQEVDELPFVKDILKLIVLNSWLSDGNTLGKLHMDQYDNFLCQISGRKQAIIFDPRNNGRFYEGHILEAMLRFENGTFYRDRIMQNTAMTMAPVDITHPNFQKFPTFAEAYPLNCTIEAGDVLYLPAFWWHEVQSYPDPQERRNLAVNFWYEPFLTKEFPCMDCPMDVNPKYRHLL